MGGALTASLEQCHQPIDKNVLTLSVNIIKGLLPWVVNSVLSRQELKKISQNVMAMCVAIEKFY